MKIPFTCESCGEVQDVEWSQIGQKTTCRSCGTTGKVPRPMESDGAAAGPPPMLRFACPACGRKFATKPELAGKKIRCNRCGAGVRVPGGQPASVAPSSGAARKVPRSAPRFHRRRSGRSAAAQPGPTRPREPTAPASTCRRCSTIWRRWKERVAKGVRRQSCPPGPS